MAVESHIFLTLLTLILIALIYFQDRVQKNRKLDEVPSGFEKEVEMAKRVQQGLLNTTVQTPTGLNMARKSTPAKTIGGDFYTFTNKDIDALLQKPKTPGVVEYVDKRQTYFGLCLGDVAGHGVSSALVMALTSGVLSELTWKIQSPGEVFTKLNTRLKHYLENSKVSYVTAMYGIINMNSLIYTFAKAGHPPAFHLKKDGSISTLDNEGVLLGMFENEVFSDTEVQLERGDRLVFYTDGILEAETSNKEQFGAERLKATVIDSSHMTIDDQVDHVFKSVDTFLADGQSKDDRTIVILELS